MFVLYSPKVSVYENKHTVSQTVSQTDRQSRDRKTEACLILLMWFTAERKEMVTNPTTEIYKEASKLRQTEGQRKIQSDCAGS